MSRITCVRGEHSAEIRQAILKHSPAQHFPDVSSEELKDHYRSCVWCLGIIAANGEVDCQAGRLSKRVILVDLYLPLYAIRDGTFFTTDAAVIKKLDEHFRACSLCRKEKANDPARRHFIAHLEKDMTPFEIAGHRIQRTYNRLKRRMPKAQR